MKVLMINSVCGIRNMKYGMNMPDHYKEFKKCWMDRR